MAVCNCAAVAPTGPNIVALPPPGKDLAQFQQEDARCRGYAQEQLAAPAPAGTAAPTSSTAFWPYGPLGYPYPYPGFYGPWFDGGILVGFGAPFPRRFPPHHFGFVHHGMRRG